MTFRYVAIAPSGEQVRGAIDVTNESQAERALWDANYRVVSIRSERRLPSLDALVPSLFAVKKRALIMFSRQLATLLESGVPVMRSLELLEDQATAKQLQKAIHGISKSIRGGSTFADSVRAYPLTIPPLYGRMVELGERTGHIEEMLRQIATYTEREDAVAKRVKGALAYPAFMVERSVVFQSTGWQTLHRPHDARRAGLPRDYDQCQRRPAEPYPGPPSPRRIVKTTDNSVLRRAVEGVQQELMHGEGLSGPMAKAGCYPQMLVQMVAVGEETGTLDGNLDITAEFYTSEVDQKVDALVGMMTPILTLFIGALVGFIALSLIMPMYQLIGNINDAGAGAGVKPPT